MILRGHRTVRMSLATVSELAAMAHRAENEDDDLTAIGLMEELEVREQNDRGVTDAFRRAYMALMPMLGRGGDNGGVARD